MIKKVVTKKTASEKRKIVVSKDGPYLVFGGFPLEKEIILNDEAGDALEWCLKKVYPFRETYALCRCGRSRNKPYCDGKHLKIGFNGSETASREPYNEQAEVTDGPGICLSDVPSLCAASRFCHRAGGIWRLLPRSDDAKVKKTIIEEHQNKLIQRDIHGKVKAEIDMEKDFKISTPYVGYLEAIYRVKQDKQVLEFSTKAKNAEHLVKDVFKLKGEYPPIAHWNVGF